VHIASQHRSLGRLRLGPKAAEVSWLLLACLVLLATAWALPGPAQQTDPPAKDSSLKRTRAAVDALQKWYEPATGLYRTTGWWNSANAITALANYSRISGSQAYMPIFANTISAAQQGSNGAPGFLNKCYDDEGWWALAWIDAFDLTAEPRYLQTARAIFLDMQHGWETSACGGGVWWSKDKRNKECHRERALSGRRRCARQSRAG
jgi:Glycosyl hydrolase family 76